MIFGKGFLGEGVFKTKEDSKQTKYYKVWYDMLNRCYTDKHPSYKGCYVCEQWLNFQNFAQWLVNHKNYGKAGYDLDKDLVKLGNKEYSPFYCDLIPKELNVAVISPVEKVKGCHWCSRDKKFIAAIRIHGKKKVLGYFGTELAAQEAYINAKRAHLNDLACRFKDAIKPEVYENLTNWR